MTKVSKKLHEEVKSLIIKDADILAKMVCKAAVDYHTANVEDAWERLLKSDIFLGVIQDVIATKR